MHHCHQYQKNYTRRDFLTKTSLGLGAVALTGLLNPFGLAGQNIQTPEVSGVGQRGAPHFPPKVKRIIYLFQSGAPSQVDLFDYKPELTSRHGTGLPDSVRQGQGDSRR